jgi:FkbM family methyltransferase
MLKSLARGAAERLGYEVLGPPRAFAARSTLRGLLIQEHVNVVLDVGANIGQFGLELREAAYTERIISFEPQADAHAQLVELAAGDPNWTIADRTAVGAEAGRLTMYRSRNSVSSSMLPMLASHSEAAPQAEYVGSEEVPVNRLDDLYTPSADDNLLLKIDVQGYEQPVLAGAQNTLAKCRAVIVEMSLVPLYEGQLLARPLWELLDRAGLDAWSFEPGIRSPNSGRMLQMDGIFVRRNQGAME